jgi:hypothetical protein
VRSRLSDERGCRNPAHLLGCLALAGPSSSLTSWIWRPDRFEAQRAVRFEPTAPHPLLSWLQCDYTIRMNYSTVSTNRQQSARAAALTAQTCSLVAAQLPSTKRVAQRYNLGLDTSYQRYTYSGFLTIQMMIDSYLLQKTYPGQKQFCAPLPLSA